MTVKNERLPDIERYLEEGGRHLVTYTEGAALYSMGKNTFRQMAKDAKATYKINRRVLVNIQKFDEFMEAFQEEFD